MSQSSFELITPINIDKAEHVVQLAEKKNNIFKHMMLALREIEEQLEAKQKQIRIYHQVAVAIGTVYEQKISNQEQSLDNIAVNISDITREIADLNSKRDSLIEESEVIELELNDIRDYAEQRRDKKSKREKQYHQLYHVPIVATQLKKKYVRARDKNLDAEEKVSEARATVDSLQKTIGETSKRLGESMNKKDGWKKQYEEMDNELKSWQSVHRRLEDGDKYWSQFNINQLAQAMQSVEVFITTIQKHSKSNQQLKNMMNPNNDFIKIFKMSLLEYGDAEEYAESKWGDLQVEYECANCAVVYLGWPKPDKVKTSNMLCDSCYKEKHNAMVWEKKMSRISDRLSVDRPGMPTFISSSRLSISSTNTAISSTSSTGSHKSGFKKVVQLFKGNKKDSGISIHDMD